MVKKNDQLWALRHTAEHILMQAMDRLWPGKIIKAMGPATDDGFYFDFDTVDDFKISEADFPKIEKETQKIIDVNLPLIKKEISIGKARELFKDNPYKMEWLDDIEGKDEKATIYYTGSPPAGGFVDLCAGPHLKLTGEVKAFKLLSIAGAYWHGDEKNKMLTRIYGTAFPTKKELDEYLWRIEEAKKRDHRKLNNTLQLYMISEEMGQGLVTLLPNGTVVAEELEEWARETERKWGYVRVLTPHIASEKLFRRTGHVPYYLPHMYPGMKMEEKGEAEKDVYYLKPMNCAAHHLVYKSQPRSYRDLPLRIAEYGCVYRYESSGELHGMLRVRGPIHQNDAHIFCTEEQAGEEFQKVMDLHKYYYDALGLTERDYYLSFAIRDKNNKDKYMGSDEMWEKAEKITLDYIKKSKIPYEIEEGGAAFYGPKIDFNIRTVTGKVFSASTNQLDFFIPRAFELEYADRDGKSKTPVCIHRAPLGAHVRFVAFLTEHFAGAFPVWLSPVQAVVLPVSDKQMEYARKIVNELTSYGLRIEFDDDKHLTLSYRIRQAELQKVPYILVVGDKEKESGTIMVRKRGQKEQKLMKVEEFVKAAKEKIEKRSLEI